MQEFIFLIYLYLRRKDVPSKEFDFYLDFKKYYKYCRHCLHWVKKSHYKKEWRYTTYAPRSIEGCISCFHSLKLEAIRRTVFHLGHVGMLSYLSSVGIKRYHSEIRYLKRIWPNYKNCYGRVEREKLEYELEILFKYIS